MPKDVNDREASSVRQFRALGTMALVSTIDARDLDAAEALLRKELEAIDLACSRFRSDSEVSQVNRANGNVVVVTELLAEVVAAALQVADWTEGAVDPTIGASLVALGYDRDFAAMKSDLRFDNARVVPVAGWTCIELDSQSRTLRVPAGVCLDLGSTAKAFAADRAALRIASAIGPGVLVNLGGDISVQGAPFDGWSIGLALDCSAAPEKTDAAVSVREGGLASSGTEVRRWRQGDHQVHHIIDPWTGDCAATCWRLATVAASTCVQANAASTAAIVWGEAAVQRLSKIEMPCRLVHNDGSVLAINGWPADVASAHDSRGETA
jgi:thiamine biosynthesis lipoprotein